MHRRSEGLDCFLTRAREVIRFRRGATSAATMRMPAASRGRTKREGHMAMSTLYARVVVGTRRRP